MRRAPAVAGALAIACIMHASRAGAEAPKCVDRPGEGTSVRVPIQGPADFGVPQDACARTAFHLETRGAILVATDDFYGSVLLGAALRGTAALPWADSWVSLYVPGLEARYVANATIDAWKTSVGAGALGGHVPIGAIGPVGFVAHARALLPSERSFANARRYGVESGVTSRWAPTEWFQILGSLGSPSTWTVTPGRNLYRWDPTIGVDVLFRPYRWLGASYGASLRPLESLDPRAQVRFYPYRGLTIALGAAFPMLGRDRTDASGALSVGWDGL